MQILLLRNYHNGHFKQTNKHIHTNIHAHTHKEKNSIKSYLNFNVMIYIFSCGAYALNYDPTTCYAERNLTAVFPGCCTPRVLCRGDEGYDAVKHHVG